MTTLPSPHHKYKYIVHLGDIHCRQNTRIEEYRDIFNKLFISIQTLPRNETIIVNTGDTVHNKNEIRPEGLQLVKELFVGCAELFPTIIIPGNHDGLIQNKSRLDSITPIIEMLNHKNLYYLKKSGLYGFGNILFNNMSIFDDPSGYIKGHNIPSIYRNEYDYIIALFHGPVNGAVMGNGIFVENPLIMPELFDAHHIALLGDIHLAQDITISNDEKIIDASEWQSYDDSLWQIKEEYTSDRKLKISRTFRTKIRYPSSLIQQNHGESINLHGYTLWDLTSCEYKHIDIPNDFGYYTIEINNGHLVTDIKNLPKYTRLRIKCYNSIASEIKKILSELKEHTTIIETSYIRTEPLLTEQINIQSNKISIFDLHNVACQEPIIKEYLTTRLKITNQNTITKILSLNNKYNNEIIHSSTKRNIKWKPIKLSWDNMFSYGENNSIDFTKLNGINGIFGQNRSGKSSVLSILMFVLFDKFERGYKGSFILNTQKTSFKCKLEFEISGTTYFIERKGIAGRNGNVKVDVRFWRLINGTEEDLHGVARRDTNDIIRDYIGTYEDFILTSVSFQSATNLSFMDMGNAERKDLLSSFIGLNIFDQLNALASEKVKELNILLKPHKNINYQNQLDELRNNNIAISKLIDDTNNNLHQCNLEYDVTSNQRADISSLLVKLDPKFNSYSISAFTVEREKLVNQQLEYNTKIESITASASKYNATLNDINIKLKQFDAIDLESKLAKYNIKLAELNSLEQRLSLINKDIAATQDKIDKLANYKYNPNCKYCCNNAFVLDAKQAESKLPELNNTLQATISKIDILKEEIQRRSDIKQLQLQYTTCLSEYKAITSQQSKLDTELKVMSARLKSSTDNITHITNTISEYNQHLADIVNNKQKQEQIRLLTDKLNSISTLRSNLNKTLLMYNSKLEVNNSKITELTTLIEKISELEREFELHDLYIKIMNRDGLSYMIISEVVPKLQSEINNILSQFTDYSIELNTDGKNILPYIVYPHGKWPVELASGYERFILSIIIKIALSNISNIPKSNFITIDEGFSAMDAINLPSIAILFSILKQMFDFSIIITHMDAVKDMVDNIIEIKHDGPYANIIY